MIQSLVKLARESVLRLNRDDFAALVHISAGELDVREQSTDVTRATELGLAAHDIIRLAHMGDELQAVTALMDQLREEERATTARDPMNAADSPLAAQAIRVELVKKMGFLQELRTRAYGKVVVVRRPDDGLLRVYRIAQANHGFPYLEYDSPGRGKLRLMLINRQSPVASQLVSASLGDNVELRTKNEHGVWTTDTFEVVAVVHLERHFGNELLVNYQNFKGFVLSHADLPASASADDVARSFAIGLERVQGILKGVETTLPASERPRREVQRGDEERLGAHFYTRTTRLQESLLQRPSHGLVVVTGVAGSGKTSVALGRAKVLCDRTRHDGEDEPDFFRSETAVGFVLSAQLSTYLQRACAQLALHDMPVHEYRQLREDLITKRALEEGGYQRGPSGAGEAGVGIDGTILWLRAADAEVTKVLAARLRSAVAKPPAEQEAVGARRRTTKLRNAEQEAALAGRWRSMEADFDRLCALRERPAASSTRFRIERFVAEIDAIRAKFARDLEADKCWSGNENNELRQNVRNALRERIVRALRLPDAYAEAVQTTSFADMLRSSGLDVHRTDLEAALRVVRDRLAGHVLSDTDIDVILALYHLLSVDYRGRDGKDPISHLEETSHYSQVFIDEFQDFTEVQIFLMGVHADPRRQAVTMVGDLRQRLHQGRAPRYEECFPGSSSEELEMAFLLENKRQCPALAKFSHHFRKLVLGDHVADAEVGEVDPAELPKLIEIAADAMADALYSEILAVDRTQSVAVLCANRSEAARVESVLHNDLRAEFRETRVSRQADLCHRYYVHFTTPLEAKGLEFDTVIVAGLDQFDIDNPMDANACYVAVSRPRSRLSIVVRAGGVDRRVRELVDQGLLVPAAPGLVAEAS